jgi:hypothetical protein
MELAQPHSEAPVWGPASMRSDQELVMMPSSPHQLVPNPKAA